MYCLTMLGALLEARNIKKTKKLLTFSEKTFNFARTYFLQIFKVKIPTSQVLVLKVRI